MTPIKPRFICGTRAVIQKGPNDFRVVCASCNGGGNTPYGDRNEACSAAVSQSARPCTAGTYSWGHGCGAR